MNLELIPVFGWLQPMEMAAIFLIVLLLFGAKKLPELARGVGKSMGEFKKAREEFENEIKRAEHDTSISDEPKKTTTNENSDKA